MSRAFAPAALAILLAGCGGSQRVPPDSQFGANPVLPEPSVGLLPQTRIPAVVGWKNGETPTVPAGFAITPLATGLSSPRNVLGLPNGDVLVVESKKTDPEPLARPKDFIFGLLLGQAHGKGEQPSNRILLVRDVNGDGKADQVSVLIDKLNSPFGGRWSATHSMSPTPTRCCGSISPRDRRASLRRRSRCLTCRPGRSTTIGPKA